MKKIICILMSIIMAAVCAPFSANAANAIYSCTFDSAGETMPTLHGAAQVKNDADKGGNVLYLDGSSGAYANLQMGLLNGYNAVTVSFDVKPDNNSGNFFTFAIGADSTKYSFFRIRGTEIRNAITTGSYMNEREVKGVVPYNNEWMNVAIVFDGYNMKLYVNGNLISENTNTEINLTDLGSDLQILFGKSLYDGDGYFKGSFDNIKIYPEARSKQEIKDDVTLTLPLLYSLTLGSLGASVGTDSHTAVRTTIDGSNINSYVKASQDLKAVPLNLNLRDSDTEVYIDDVEINAPYTADLTSRRILKLVSGNESVSYAINTPKIAKNPVLPGQYADPDISVLDGRFWIFPTTDGVDGWGGCEFHAFSSVDLVNWIDEGVILDVKEKGEKTNAQGVKIATSSWSDGSAWAPAATEKNGKYYFYYCGNVAPSYTATYGSGKAIGVATANSPNGPYTAADSPILYPKMLEDSGIGFSGQVIDPSVFTDTDGTSYILFGNSTAAMAQLNDNMTTANTSTLRVIYGLDGFRESVAVFKRKNVYYFTWSCDDTGSENYCVNYGYTRDLRNDVTAKGTILQKDAENGILATGHQSVLYLPDTDKCFIAYHRFYTPLGFFGDGLGFHRETCIDEVTFKQNLVTDEINKVTPTYEGTGAYNVKGEVTQEKIPTHYGEPEEPEPTPTPEPQPQPQPAPSNPSSQTPAKVTVGAVKLSSVKAGKKLLKTKWVKINGVTGYQIQYSTSKKFTKKTTKNKYTNKNALNIKKLKAKKKYFVRVRAYKTVNGKTYYGNWSNIKNAKTK